MAAQQDTSNATAEIKLPLPKQAGGKSLFEALKDRKSTREFGDDKLNFKIISNLLWAAFGLNRLVRGLVDRRSLAKLMQLRPQQRVIVVQTVGYPKN